MNIFVYSDESGVFDKVHNDIFVFGGVILLNAELKDEWSRKYAHAERVLRIKKGVPKNYELKATQVTNSEKGKLFRSLNQCNKFCGIVNQKEVLSRIFDSKKDKQRYLDYVYKISIKRAFQHLIDSGALNPNEVENIYFFVDEHTTATNGRYELREALEQEFKHGTYNYNWGKYYPPIFPKVKAVNLEFCNSENKLLVRAADIVANRVYYLAKNKMDSELYTINNLGITYFP